MSSKEVEVFKKTVMDVFYNPEDGETGFIWGSDLHANFSKTFYAYTPEIIVSFCANDKLPKDKRLCLISIECCVECYDESLPKCQKIFDKLCLERVAEMFSN